MKIELFPKTFNAGHWRTLQVICACSQICKWSKTYIPSKTVKTQQSLPWINHVLRRLMRKQLRLFHRRTKSKKDLKKYVDLKKTVQRKTDISLHKQNLWKEHLNANWDHRHNTHTLCKTIHGLSNRAAPTPQNCTITFNKKIATSPKNIVNCFKLLYKGLLNFLDANDIIYKHQFGFRERHSTQQAIITLVEKITGAWDSDDMVIGVFLDLKKAFDTVPHDILLKKLHAYGIRGNALKLLELFN